MSMTDRLTIELNREQAQLLSTVLSCYESGQLDRSGKLLPAERSGANIYENLPAALELRQRIQ